ncbi:MAG TPA: GNAT family N-acetyltransferase [Armatimonadota bacterium]|jgi:GNAT superfamily N-acetyltransferase
MHDIICPLYEIPDYSDLMKQLASENIVIRSSRPWEREALCTFISERFGQGWVDETSVGLTRQPVSVIVALKDNKIIGFAAYEVSARGFFGPTGVDEAFRGLGVGKALFYEAMTGLKSLGYVYGIIGASGPVNFYLKAMKGMVLPEDWKNVYTGATGAVAVECRPKEG